MVVQIRFPVEVVFGKAAAEPLIIVYWAPWPFVQARFISVQLDVAVKFLGLPRRVVNIASDPQPWPKLFWAAAL